MPDDRPTGGGLGATLKSKAGPFPVYVWLLILTAIALAVYLWQKRKGAGASSGGGTPSDVGQPGVVVLNEDQGGGDMGGGGGDDDDKKHKKHKPPKPPENKTRKITVDKNETLGQLAKQRHWSQRTLKEVEELNVTAGKGEWTPSTRLKKGETVVRPVKG